MKQIKIWKFIHNNLLRNSGVMLLYVLESRGSSPGRQGFFMAVNAENEMEGSIGGGIMEHKFVEGAKNRLRIRSGEQESIHQETEDNIRRQIHNKSAARDQSGMICSGEQTILTYEVLQSDRDTIEKIILSLEQNKNGALRLSPLGIEFSETLPPEDFKFYIKSAGEWEYVEKTGNKNNLFIVGGGHCSLAFSKIMRELDFYIRVFETRDNLKTMLENQFAHEHHVLGDYSEVGRMIPAGNSYVVLMTFGYRTDDAALRSLLDKEFRYLGLLGSQSKIDEMFEGYRKEGIQEQCLQRIYTPIGLQIKSQTPEEIAISIAAEIIKIKNKDL